MLQLEQPPTLLQTISQPDKDLTTIVEIEFAENKANVVFNNLPPGETKARIRIKGSRKSSFDYIVSNDLGLCSEVGGIVSEYLQGQELKPSKDLKINRDINEIVRLHYVSEMLYAIEEQSPLSFEKENPLLDEIYGRLFRNIQSYVGVQPEGIDLVRCLLGKTDCYGGFLVQLGLHLIRDDYRGCLQEDLKNVALDGSVPAEQRTSAYAMLGRSHQKEVREKLKG